MQQATPSVLGNGAMLGNGAIQGLKVVDLTRVLGGPYCTQILGDHGADIVKVEPPQGDEVRHWGPPFHEDMASYFIGVNRNKRSIGLNLREAEGHEVLFRLLADADVLIENLRVGTMAKWGLGYHEVLQARFPKLIYCHITGFGAQGPLGGYPGYDAIVQAMTGLMSINGTDETGFLRLGVPMVDIGAGLYAAIAILMALLERQRSGQGQFIDMSLFDSGLALTHPHAANHFLSGTRPPLTGNSHPNISPYDKYPTRTCDVFLGIGNDRAFGRLCKALGREELAQDPRFVTNADRVAHRAELNRLITDALADVDGEAFSTQLLEEGLPAGPVLPLDDALKQPHTQAREMVVESGWYRGVATPIKFSRSARAPINHPPPAHGEHSREVLEELGYDSESIDGLLAQGVVSAASST